MVKYSIIYILGFIGTITSFYISDVAVEYGVWLSVAWPVVWAIALGKLMVPVFLA